MKYFLLVLIFIFIGSELLAEVTGKPNIYIQCDNCDFDNLRHNVAFVNFVRDKADADIFVSVLRQWSASGVTLHTFDFNGRKKFEGMNDTIVFQTPLNATEDLIETTYAEKLNLCLIRYLLKTSYSDSLKPATTSSPETAANNDTLPDPWKLWIFELSGYSYFSGEKSNRSNSLNSSFSFGRVTKSLKLEFGCSFNYSESKYDYENSTYLSLSRSRNAWANQIYSLSDHFSVGNWFSWQHSLYNNIGNQYGISEGVEYSLFDYDESFRRQIKLQYKLSLNQVHYLEETIYMKTQDLLSSERLSIIAKYKKPWGSYSASIGFSNYFYDFTKNSLDLYLSTSINVYKGLNVNAYIFYESIHNQLSLRRDNASVDDVLLRRKALSTQFSYWGNIGLSYTFGSIYSNVVNTRFD